MIKPADMTRVAEASRHKARAAFLEAGREYFADGADPTDEQIEILARLALQVEAARQAANIISGRIGADDAVGYLTRKH